MFLSLSIPVIYTLLPLSILEAHSRMFRGMWVYRGRKGEYRSAPADLSGEEVKGVEDGARCELPS